MGNNLAKFLSTKNFYFFIYTRHCSLDIYDSFLLYKYMDTNEGSDLWPQWYLLLDLFDLNPLVPRREGVKNKNPQTSFN